MANETNQLLYRVIQNLAITPGPSGHSSVGTVGAASAGGQANHGNGAQANPSSSTDSPAATQSQTASRRDTAVGDSQTDTGRKGSEPGPKSSDIQPSAMKTLGSSAVKPKGIAVHTAPGDSQSPLAFEFPRQSPSDLPSNISIPVTAPGMSTAAQQHAQKSDISNNIVTSEDDPFDARETVNQLTLQFLSEHEETRIAALEWLSMLHQKSPSNVSLDSGLFQRECRSDLSFLSWQTLARDDGTFPALLKTLSDPSEDVVKHDLQLLAQISANSDDSYFSSFLVNLLELFSTDRRLLETRGSLIIRQLCLNLNTERIFRTLAEILEKDDVRTCSLVVGMTITVLTSPHVTQDLEFASLMVIKLNMILITSPELSEFRKRLKNIESKVSALCCLV